MGTKPEEVVPAGCFGGEVVVPRFCYLVNSFPPASRWLANEDRFRWGWWLGEHGSLRFPEAVGPVRWGPPFSRQPECLSEDCWLFGFFVRPERKLVPSPRVASVLELPA